MFKLNYSIISHKALQVMAANLVRLIEAGDPEALGILIFFNKLKQSLSAYDGSLTKDRGSSYTELLFKKDFLRDEGFLALRFYLEACSHSAKEGWAAAANDLLAIFRKYGWSLHLEGYQNETASLSGLIKELSEADNVAKLTLLLATGWFDELKLVAIDFVDLYQESLNEGDDGVLTIADSRKTLTADVRALFSMLEFMHGAANNRALNALVIGVETLVNETMATARAAETRKQNKEVENTEEINQDTTAS